MARLISFVRELVGEAEPPTGDDNDGACASDSTDASIQNALDETRERIKYATVASDYTRLPGGAIAYLDYDAGGYFDDALVLMGLDYTPFAEDDYTEFDALNGRFTFAQSQKPILYLIGDRYDPYAAAVSVLTKMAATVKSDVDFKDANTSLSASQAAKAMLTLAAQYQGMARIRTVALGRSDTN